MITLNFVIQLKIREMEYIERASSAHNLEYDAQLYLVSLAHFVASTIF